jgi:hypothetical protein
MSTTWSSAKQNLEMADGCLDMVREVLVVAGLDMDGCPPMMYDDAIATLIARLGRPQGLRTWDDVRALVRRPGALTVRNSA